MTNDSRSGIKDHPVVSHEEWLSARTAFLAKEKEFTRLRDELSQQRRALPWEKVDKQYVFDGPKGKETLAELFESRSQLVVYHFMFDPEWEEGCSSCSFWADSFNGNGVHYAVTDREDLDREGISVFSKDESGAVFHTYSCYARGIDMMNVTYQYLDLTPRGRDEDGLEWVQAWVRYHDRYQED